jgi:lipopolysaccharide transport system permease protein
MLSRLRLRTSEVSSGVSTMAPGRLEQAAGGPLRWGGILIRPVREIYRYRRILGAAVQQGLRDRWVGSTFGIIWLAIYPLLFLAMYAAVFVHVLQVRVPNLRTEDYVLAIFCGLIPFLAFTEGFSTATTSITSNASLVRNTLFPIELIPLREVIVGHVSMGLGIAMLWIAAIIYTGLQWSQLLVPVILVVQIILTAGFAWIAATLNVFFRDIGKLVPILTLFLMLISPIAYTPDMVPEGLRPWLGLNPLAALIDLYRAVLLEGRVPLAELGEMTVLSLLVALAGYFFLIRLKSMFSDHV